MKLYDPRCDSQAPEKSRSSESIRRERSQSPRPPQRIDVSVVKVSDRYRFERVVIESGRECNLAG